MKKQIDYKKNQVHLKKRQPTKLENRGNLGYLGKSVNHINLIKRRKLQR
jgi:hypothetical protein